MMEWEPRHPLHARATKRLIVQPISVCQMKGHTHLDDLESIYGDSEVQSALSLVGAQTSREALCHIIEEEGEHWKIGRAGLIVAETTDPKHAVAIIKVQRSPMEPPRDLEVVCAVHPNFRQDGYATEALLPVLDWVFECGEPNLVARVHPANEASSRLVKKLGFVQGDDRVAPGEHERVFELTQSAFVRATSP